MLPSFFLRDTISVFLLSIFIYFHAYPSILILFIYFFFFLNSSFLQIIKDTLNRSKLDLRANVSYVKLYTFIKFTKKFSVLKHSLKGMLNQRLNSDAEPVLLTKRTYTYTIYATKTHHYVLIHQHFTRSHT